MSILQDLVLQWCNSNEKPVPAEYLVMLGEACEKAQPSFTTFEYGERFREITSKRQHFAVQQINSAVEEASGAERLIKLVGELPENELGLAAKFLKHAEEEVFHHGLFLELFENVFPEISIDPQLEDEVRHCTPDLQRIEELETKVSNQRILEEIVQINIGELRNLIQLKLSAPVMLAHCREPSYLGRCEAVMDRLMHDEGGHVYYTAVLIERLISSGFRDELRSLMDDAFYLFDLEARRFMWPELYPPGESAEARSGTAAGEPPGLDSRASAK